MSSRDSTYGFSGPTTIELVAQLASRMLLFMTTVTTCATMADLADRAAAEVAAVGMTAIASGMVSGPTAANGAIFHFNNWPQSWLDLYIARGYMEKDPLPRWAIVSGAAAAWTEVMDRLPPTDPAHEVFAAAQSHGFREGLVVPVRTLAGQLGLVSVGGDRGRIEPAERQFLQSICTATLHRAEALTQSPEPAPPPALSRRERECLALLVQGLNEREIAASLGIKDVTARFHLDNARTKTGARSRIHLAGIANQWLAHRGPVLPQSRAR